MSDNRAAAPAGVAAGVGFVASAVVRARHYWSAQHLFAAEHFTRLAADYECSHIDGPQKIHLRHRAYVMGAVLETVAFLESFVNEIFKDAADGHTGGTDGLTTTVITRLAAAWQMIEGASVLDKYRMVRGCSPTLRRRTQEGARTTTSFTSYASETGSSTTSLATSVRTGPKNN